MDGMFRRITARRWFDLAGDGGHAEAWNYRGYMHRKGLGVIVDYNEAMRCHQKAADGGEAFAWNNMQFMYRHGLGVSQSDNEAQYCERMAKNSPEKIQVTNTILKQEWLV